MSTSRYLVEDRIEENRFYVTCSGRDEQSGASVLIKKIRESFCEDKDLLHELDKALRTISNIDHENIQRVLNWYGGEDPGSGFVLIEEPFSGWTLKEILKRNKEMKTDVVTGLGIQIGRALEAAARAGVVHGHLTPESIFIHPSGMLKVSDFRILEIITSFITSPIDFQGRDIRYLSPEVITGSPSNTASDIYSLGIILYEAITGIMPFQDESMVSIALKQVKEEIREPAQITPQIPRLLNNLIMRCLEKDPARRIKDPARLVKDLELIQNSQLEEPEPPESETVVILPEDDLEQPPPPAVKISEKKQKPAAPAPVIERENPAPESFSVEELEADLFPEDEEAAPVEDDLEIKGPKARYVPWFSLALILAGVFILTSGAAFILTSLSGNPRTRNIIYKAVSSLCPDKSQSRICTFIQSHFGSETPETTVPDLRGMTWEEAQKRLKSLGLEIVFDRQEYREGAIPGRVITHDPPPDMKVRPGQEVRIVMSRGKQEITVPNAIGLMENDATKIIETQDLLFVKEFKSEFSDKPFGEVVRQDPAPGKVVPVHTPVTLWTSKGVKMQMPEVIGLYPRDAEETLREAGIAAKPQFEYPESYNRETCAKECIVHAQVPEPGKEITANTQPRLILKAPAKVQPEELSPETPETTPPLPPEPGLPPMPVTRPPAANPTVEPPSPQPPPPKINDIRAANVQVQVPPEPLLQEVKVMVTDATGTTTAYRKIHSGGDFVKVYVEGRGPTKVEVYIDGALVASQQLPGGK